MKPYKNSIKHIEELTKRDINSWDKIIFEVTDIFSNWLPYIFVKTSDTEFTQLPISESKPHTQKDNLTAKHIQHRIKYLCADGLKIHRCYIEDEKLHKNSLVVHFI